MITSVGYFPNSPEMKRAALLCMGMASVCGRSELARQAPDIFQATDMAMQAVEQGYPIEDYNDVLRAVALADSPLSDDEIEEIARTAQL